MGCCVRDVIGQSPNTSPKTRATRPPRSAALRTPVRGGRR